MKQLIQRIEDICRQENWVFDQPTVSYILALLKLPKPPAPEIIVKEATKDLPHPDEILTFTQFYASLPYLPHSKRKTVQNRVLRHTPPEEWPTYLPIPISRATYYRLKSGAHSRHDHTNRARIAIHADPYADSISNLARTYGVSRALVSKIRKEAASK